MSHELEFVNGQASMAYAGELPWHGLGVPVSNDLTPQEMLKAAQLDWKVEKYPNYTKVGELYLPTGEQALVRDRDNKVLSPHMGAGWEPLQNEDALEFFAEFVKAGDMEMNTAGSLKGGKYIWALAKVKDSFTVFQRDTVESYLFLCSPHVYGTSLTADFTPTRIVCQNTLSLALSEHGTNRVKINHRRKFDAEEVKALLGIAHRKLGTYKEAAEFLGSKRYNHDQLLEYFAGVFPATGENKKGAKLSKNGEIAVIKTETSPGSDIMPGTWWNAFNSVTYMMDHVVCKDRDTRMFHSWLGAHGNKKIQALESAIEFATNS